MRRAIASAFRAELLPDNGGGDNRVLLTCEITGESREVAGQCMSAAMREMLPQDDGQPQLVSNS